MRVASNTNLMERFLRGALGATFVVIGPPVFDLMQGSTLSWFLFVFGVGNIIAALSGWCFMYGVLGINTLGGGDATGDSEKALEIDDLGAAIRRIRVRAFIGFSSVTILVVGFYILEAYRSSVQLAENIEFAKFHQATDVLGHRYKTLRVTGATRETIAADLGLTAQMVLGQSDKAYFLVLFDEGDDSVIANSGVLDSQSKALRERLSLEAARVHEMGMGADEHHFFERDGNRFGLIRQKLDKDVSLGLALELAGREFAIAYVVNEMLVSSLIVFWLGVWAAYGVSLFIHRNLEKSNQAIRHAVTTRPETGLPNQRALANGFADMVEIQQAPKISLLLISVRGFSSVQDEYGSDLANRFMLRVAEVLQRGLRQGEVMGQLDDGRLALLLQSSQHVQEMVANLSEQHAVSVGDFIFAIDATSAEVICPDHAEIFDELLSLARLTLQIAKRDFIPFMSFVPELLVNRQRQAGYAAQLHDALQEGQLEMFLQPKVCLRSECIDGAELLMRWRHPVDGLLSPAEFIPIIENSNSRRLVTEFVIDTAVKYLEELGDLGYDLTIAMNISPYDLVDQGIIAHFSELAAERKVEPSRLEIEVVESETSVQTTTIANAMSKLHKYGFRLAIDDFGTGMSSLSYCHEMTFDTIKIDRSFVARVVDYRDSAKMVHSIISMARSFGWEVVAEGVEDQRTADVLTEMGCQLAQGYLYARPMPMTEFVEWLKHVKCDRSRDKLK